MLTLYALRHASTEWNERGLMQGRRDVPLSASGRDDAARWRLPADVPHAVRLFSSPLRRAIETATLLCGRPPTIAPALIEMDWGRWESGTLGDARRADPDAYEANARRGLDFRPPGGESPRDVAVRVAAWLASLAPSGAPALVVTHRGVLNAMLTLATGWDMVDKPPVRLRDACLHRFTVAPGTRLVLEQANVALAPPRL